MKFLTKKFNDYFLGLDEKKARGLHKKAKLLGRKFGMVIYSEKGRPRWIGVASRPWVVSKEQMRFFHTISLDLKEALTRLIKIYWENDLAKLVIPLTEKEKEWFSLARHKGLTYPQTIFDRLDGTVTFDRADWKKNFHFLEPNSVGVGGIHYIPAACQINEELFLDDFKEKVDPTLTMQTDVRDLLMDELMAHAALIGRRRPKIAFIEDRSVAGGTYEFEFLVGYFRRKGIKTFLADPRDLRLARDEIYFRDNPIDVLYRDCEIDELIKIEHGEKIALKALKKAFVRNQVVSSFAGEFDHKSAFEIFTSSAFQRFFTQSQRKIFKKYIPWTRLIWERKTTGPDGQKIELIDYIRKNQNRLVMKPNREYGGKDVTLGRYVKKSAWEKMLQRALLNPSTIIVQRLVKVHEEYFPIIDQKGKVALDDFFVVSAFVATKKGIAVLGRYSKERIVNVSRKGGLIPVYIVNESMSQ